MALLGFSQLVQTVHDSIQMHTPVGKRLVNSLFEERSAILLMQMQNAHNLLHPSAFRPFLFQIVEHALVGLRPVLAPLFHRFGILKGTGSLLKQGKIMEGIKDILLFLIASSVSSKQCPFIKDVNMKGISLDRYLTAGFSHRHRIAVGFKGGLTVGGESHSDHLRAVVLK